MENCKKCGLPEKMYLCNTCEDIQEEEGVCGACGNTTKIDNEYHDNCPPLGDECEHKSTIMDSDGIFCADCGIDLRNVEMYEERK